MKPVKVGVIGCGIISKAYFNGMKKFPLLEVVACSDLDMKRAEEKAAEFNIPRACTVKELLKDPEIEIVVNLTIPAAHAPVNTKILDAGKHAYTEKPFALTVAEGKKVCDLAKRKGLLAGSAPDTFLGAGNQTCRAIIDEGLIGRPVAATAFLAGHGPESWHGNPEFYYKKGGGPMLDMGPYYITALVNMLGPVKSVCGIAKKSFPERLITSQPFYGKRVKVDVSTHVAGVLEFKSGCVVSVITSFDVWKHSLPNIEVHGTLGSLSVPDPNQFHGPIKLIQGRDGGVRYSNWAEIGPLYPYVENLRGMGVADLAYALRNKRKARASSSLAFHVLEVMESFETASKTGKTVSVKSACERPVAMLKGLPFGVLDR